MAKKEHKLEIGWQDVNISQLVKADWNYKTEDTEKSAKLRENIKRNGQIENLLIRELPTGFYEVVNGNHRLDVMSEIGLEKAHVYNFGKITQNQAVRIAIETNETRFQSDNIKLAALIKDIIIDFPAEQLSETMPYSVEELNNMEALLNFDTTQFRQTVNFNVDPLEMKVIITFNVQDEKIKEELKTLVAKYSTAKIK